MSWTTPALATHGLAAMGDGRWGRLSEAQQAALDGLCGRFAEAAAEAGLEGDDVSDEIFGEVSCARCRPCIPHVRRWTSQVPCHALAASIQEAHACAHPVAARARSWTCGGCRSVA